MSDRLQERVAIVTGGAAGIGAAIAQAFVAEGARVVIADLNADAARETAVALGADRAITVHADVTRETDIAAMVSSTL
ncbi:MAG TPA: SDR family NAD(P)-dependent oxidoreductase, partial [Casimicrobiaceae bacterium]